ncbi:hypothetical protein GQ457_17G012550 [Hibiscus cannabinus]
MLLNSYYVQGVCFEGRSRFSVCVVQDPRDWNLKILDEADGRFYFEFPRDWSKAKGDGLEYVFPTLMALQGFPQLEKRCVHGCRQLKQLVRYIEGRKEHDVVLQQLQFLKPLTKFLVSGCPLLSHSFVHLEVEEAHLEDVQLSTFKGSFKYRNRLRLCGTTEYHNLVLEINKDGLNGLTFLEVERCKDIECLVDATTQNGPNSAFTHLEKLRIIIAGA